MRDAVLLKEQNMRKRKSEKKRDRLVDEPDEIKKERKRTYKLQQKTL
jgi:hypothetical protein